MAGVASKIFDVETLKERFLECDICKEIFDEENRHPRLLPCLHTLCKECIFKLINNEKITCPRCQKKHNTTGNSIDTFPKDNTRFDLLDFVKVQKEPTNITCGSCDKNLPAKFRCKDCSEFLCTECNDFHVHNKKFKSHYVFSIESTNFEKAQLENFKHESSCSIPGHKDALKFYCDKNTCKKPICTTCAIAEHKETNGHILCDILKVYSQEKAQMEKKREILEKKKENALSIVKLIEKEENDLYQNGEAAKENIRAQFETCLKILERRRDELVQDVDVTMTRKRKILEVHQQELENLNNLITDAIGFFDQSLLYKNYPAFLQIVTTMKNRFEYLIDQTIDVIPHENACCEFSALNMGMEFQKYVNTIGKMYHTSAYPPNTVIAVRLSETKDKEVLISVSFRDKSGNEITDSDTIPDVTVRIISETQPIDPVEVPCESSQYGKFNAVIKNLRPGKYKVEAVMFKKCFGADVKEIKYKNRELRKPDEDAGGKNQLPTTNAEKDPDELSINFIPLSLHKDQYYISDDCLTFSNVVNEGIEKQNNVEQAVKGLGTVIGSMRIAYPRNCIIEVEMNYTIIQDLPNDEDIFTICFIYEEDIDETTDEADIDNTTDEEDINNTTVEEDIDNTTDEEDIDNIMDEEDINNTTVEEDIDNTTDEEDIDTTIDYHISICAKQCQSCDKVCLCLNSDEECLKHIPISNATANASFKGKFTIFMNSRKREIEFLDEQYVQIFLFTDVDFYDGLRPVFGLNNQDHLSIKLQVIKAKIVKDLTLPQNQVKCESSEKEM